MTSILTAALFLLLSAPQSKPVATVQTDPDAAPTNPAFEKMKTLVGVWERTNGKDRMLNTFHVFGEDSALLHVESFPDGGQDIISVIYPAGAELRMDHYCYLRNQPRFVAKPQTDPNVIEFEMRDITNLAAHAEHMNATTWRFIDNNHLTQEWHRAQDGKEVLVKLEFVRKK